MPKIRITRLVPVKPKHGIEIGNVYEAEWRKGKGRSNSKWFVMGAAGEEVGIWPHECEIIGEDEDGA